LNAAKNRAPFVIQDLIALIKVLKVVLNSLFVQKEILDSERNIKKISFTRSHAERMPPAKNVH